jgi:hypothetical protein
MMVDLIEISQGIKTVCFAFISIFQNRDFIKPLDFKVFFLNQPISIFKVLKP